MSTATLSSARRSPSTDALSSLTIGRLARAAGVGVETIRYYQRRRLLAIPSGAGGVRRYPVAMVKRVHFIKRSQGLGFSLDEIRELLRLESGGSRATIQTIAADRLQSIREKLATLARMERVLSQLLRECEHTDAAAPCPIIAAVS